MLTTSGNNVRQSIKKYDVSTDEACKSMCLKQGRVRFTGSSGNLDEYFIRRAELLCFQTIFLFIFLLFIILIYKFK